MKNTIISVLLLFFISYSLNALSNNDVASCQNEVEAITKEFKKLKKVDCGRLAGI